MSAFRLAPLVVLLALLFHCSLCQTTYTVSFDTVRRYFPSYNLGYVLSGYTVMLNLTTQATQTTFD